MPASSDPCADPCPVLDYIDLMLLHSPLAGKERRLEAWRALVEARNKGKLRTIGVSNLYMTLLPLERCSLYTHHICARLCSGVRHLEEIREAGLETPAVNQIEVCNRTFTCASRSHGFVRSHPDTPIMPTEGDRGIREKTQHRH